jgi:hypothetical protein
LLQALDHRRKVRQGGTDPSMTLATLYFRQRRYDECIRSAQRGLKILQHRPGTEASIGKLNLNIDLAIYEKLADQQPRRVRQAEPYLKEASRLLPDFGGADFLLGTVPEIIHEDADLARSHFTKAQERGDKSARTENRRRAH